MARLRGNRMIGIVFRRFRAERAFVPVASARSAVGQDEPGRKIFIVQTSVVRYVMLSSTYLDAEQSEQRHLTGTRNQMIDQTGERVLPAGMLHPRTHQSPAQDDLRYWKFLPYKSDHGERTERLAQIVEREPDEPSIPFGKQLRQPFAEPGKVRILLGMFRGCDQISTTEGRPTLMLIIRQSRYRSATPA